RKVNILPCGKRRELRRSLRTRSKREAILRLEKFSDKACLPIVISDLNQQTIDRKITDSFCDITQKVMDYVKYKSSHVCEREVASIQRSLDCYFRFTSQPLQKSEAAKFIDQLDLSIATKNKYIKKISGFFRWLNHRSDIDIKNPFEGLMLRDNEMVSTKRPAYTHNQIKQLESTLNEIVEWKKWIILIGRYTGMRANEICQLYKSDIVNCDGVWCFNIDNSKMGQVIKTTNSRRYVPIHAELLALGLLIFVEKQNDHLFPHLKLYKGYYSHYFTKWFSGFRRKHRLPEFHSIRHYVASVFKNSGVPEQFAGALLGHNNQSITYNRYGKKIEISQLSELISLL
ncbi:site-specific integrase, partial [Budviciaceae bacterium BWR-B9]